MTAFAALFVPERLREATAGPAWLAAMLEVERALANAGALCGVVPATSAAAISDAGRPDHPDPILWEQLLDQGHAPGNPVEPLVRALRAHVGTEHERYVHHGATSQDVLDTAAMLVAGRACGIVVADLDRVAHRCAELARVHRSTPMVARTLLQQAVPTTFGFVAAGWLGAVLDARARLVELSGRGFAAQLGGAAGTSAVFGDDGPRMVELFAAELGLTAPLLPWHTNRVRIAELGAALATAAGVCGKIGLDVVLLAQTEVGEVREGEGGGSSTMPQKRNPVRATLARACARLAAGHASVLLGSLEQEHERAAGAWHAEWESLCGVLAYSGGAADAIADALGGLEVDAERMRVNLDASGGLVLAERVTFALADRIGRSAAHDLVGAAHTGAAPFREALLADPHSPLAPDELDLLLDPLGYLGSAETFVDRALDAYGYTLGARS